MWSFPYESRKEFNLKDTPSDKKKPNITQTCCEPVTHVPNDRIEISRLSSYVAIAVSTSVDTHKQCQVGIN